MRFARKYRLGKSSNCFFTRHLFHAGYSFKGACKLVGAGGSLHAALYAFQSCGYFFGAHAAHEC